ncbi:MAG: hypothetical protein ACOYJD_09130, partial [Christensenellales bacterium]
LLHDILALVAHPFVLVCSTRNLPDFRLMRHLKFHDGRDNLFKTAPGVTIPFPEKILETYEVFEGKGIRANVSYEKLADLVKDFYTLLPEPLFLVMHLPLTMHEESEMGIKGKLHEKVLYLDGQTQDEINAIMDSYGSLLLGDGMSQFAIASHKNNDEIFIQEYKAVDIESKAPEKYIHLLTKYGLH